MKLIHPNNITEEEDQHPTEKIRYLLEEEFSWLGRYLRESFLRVAMDNGYDLLRMITNIHVVRFSQNIMEFDPMDFIGDVYRKSHILSFDNEGNRLPVFVGGRRKYVLVSKPNCIFRSRPWKVEPQEILFHDTLERSLRRWSEHKEAIRFVVQAGRPDNYIPHWKLVIWRIPKGYTLSLWLEKEKQEIREQARKEAAQEVSLTA